LNESGEVEITYRNWAKSERKDWFPKEGPFALMSSLLENPLY